MDVRGDVAVWRGQVWEDGFGELGVALISELEGLLAIGSGFEGLEGLRDNGIGCEMLEER